jgi:hypothetical protein
VVCLTDAKHDPGSNHQQGMQPIIDDPATPKQHPMHLRHCCFAVGEQHPEYTKHPSFTAVQRTMTSSMVQV